MQEEKSPTDEQIPQTPHEYKKKGLIYKNIIKEIIIFVVIAFGVVLPFRHYIAEPYIVDGASMDPTFHTNDYLIVNKFLYKAKEPERNTVIVFQYPNATPTKNLIETILGQPPSIHTNFIKRIIGLPGDTVIVDDNNVMIVNEKNPKGFYLDQSYVVKRCKKESKNCISSFYIRLKDDEYFVMGDNRTESYDSRSWGPVNKKYFLGKPILRLWPILQISIFPGSDNIPISSL